MELNALRHPPSVSVLKIHNAEKVDAVDDRLRALRISTICGHDVPIRLRREMILSTPPSGEKLPS